MKIFHSINEFVTTKKTILTLGTFDGVHFGHKSILNKITQNTQNGIYESLVLTFFPHPRMVLQNNSEVKLLNTLEEKIELLEKNGIQNLVVHPFDKNFSELSAEEFVKTVLVEKFKIQKIIIGHDHRFGKNRTANIDDLVAYGKQYGFYVEQISVQEIQKVSISSTKIRTALLDGNIDLANEYLGYDYSLTGTVAKGQQLGRTIGFPTANLIIQENFKLIPKNGVYIVKSTIHQKEVFGMMNIGFNPTISGDKLSIEIYYLDLNRDLYDQKITVSILHYIRAEKIFSSIEALKIQLQKDQETTIGYINNYNSIN